MSPVVLSLVQAEETAKLIWPNWLFPVVAIVIFTTLMLVCWSFRDVSNRRTRVHTDPMAGADGGSHGAGHPAISSSSNDSAAAPHGH